MDDILIGGVPFLALGHHDGRFLRAPGLFAFARPLPSGRLEVLHLELAEAIDRTAGPGHARWVWALAAGMDTLLVHLFGGAVRLPAHAAVGVDTVTWHPDAEVRLHAARTSTSGGPATRSSKTDSYSQARVVDSGMVASPSGLPIRSVG